jgi:RimJ/RimL family protein N-acetyltransferase
MGPWETKRWVARPARAEDLARLLPVFQSHPDYLAKWGGLQGPAMDLGRLLSDWEALERLGGHGAYCLEHKEAPGEVAGLVDFLLTNPSRGIPWVGLLMVHRRLQGQGLGKEALAGFLEEGRRQGWTCVGTSFPESDGRAWALARSLGFRPVARIPRLVAGRWETVVVVETNLSPNHPKEGS